MILLDRIVPFVGVIAVLFGALYIGFLLTMIVRLRRVVPIRGVHKSSFSEFIPVPHGRVREVYRESFPSSRCVGFAEIVYKSTILILLFYIGLDLFGRILR